MLSLTHTLISLPFAEHLNNPLIIFVAAFIFHLFADTLLHWNLFPEQSGRYLYPLVALDVLGGLVLAWLFTGSMLFTIPVLAAIAGGNMPDVLHQLWNFLSPAQQHRAPRWMQECFRFHDNLQNETYHIGYGILWQLVLIGISASLILQ